MQNRLLSTKEFINVERFAKLFVIIHAFEGQSLILVHMVKKIRNFSKFTF